MKRSPILIAILLVSFALASCGTNSKTGDTPTPTPGPKVFVAEGHVVPQSDLTLAFTVRGKVAEILVSKGEKVAAGQVLIRLTDQEQAQASLAGAQFEHLAAKQAYDSLLRTADLAHAQAWQTYINAQQAHAAAERAWENLDLDAIEEEISNARADVNSTKADLADAQLEFDKYKDLDENNVTRKNAEDALTTSRNSYNEALRKLDEAANKRDTIQAALETTRAAESEAKRDYENTLSGADIDKLALLEQHLAASEAQLKAARAFMDGYELKAPISGVIADINPIVGQQVGPETWAVILADFSAWYVETNDLSELDVVKVEVGQQVELIADALPGQTMTGVVEEIAITPRNQAGDILYTVRILLQDEDSTLRWGMTVEVTFPEN
jgi:multidrug resistance efflux pump